LGRVSPAQLHTLLINLKQYIMDTIKNTTGSDDQTRPTVNDAVKPELETTTEEPTTQVIPDTANVITSESETTTEPTDQTTPATVDVIEPESKTIFGDFWQISKKDITIHHEGLLIHLREKGFC
jgi:hypothetical protein